MEISHGIVEQMSVRLLGSRELMGRAAATDIAQEIRMRIGCNGAVRIILAAAPSQSEMLASLVRMPGIDWAKVTAFHMDEYIGLPPAAPQRFSVWLEHQFVRHVPLGAWHPILPDGDPSKAANSYAGLLAELPIDIVCLGIGVNGHIAFNDPPVADFNDPKDVKIVRLDPTCRQQQIDDGCFENFLDVPQTAITLTIPRLLLGDRLFCVVPGGRKQRAVRDALYGPVLTDCPASILRRHPNCTLYLDPESSPDA